MIYSITVLDLCDFESIGRKMPKGQGVDASVYDGTVAPKHKSKKRSKSSTSTDTVAKSQKFIVTAIEKADEQVRALQLFLEFGSVEEKQKAKEELSPIAFGRSFTSDSNISNSNNESSTGVTDEIDDDQSSSSSVL
jgi:hypothetical protein